MSCWSLSSVRPARCQRNGIGGGRRWGEAGENVCRALVAKGILSIIDAWVTTEEKERKEERESG